MKEKILTKLKEIIYPNFEKDIVSFGFVSSIELLENSKDSNQKAIIKLTIPTNDDATTQQIKEQIYTKLNDINIESIVQITTPESRKEQSTQKPNNLLPTTKHFVMVSSGKGGVGKTTTSVNLAISLAKSGLKVGLLDCDIYGPNIPRMLGVADLQPKVTPDGKKLVPLEIFGVKMISMGVLYEREASLVWRGPVVMRAIMQLLQDVFWGALDVMVIDMPPGTGDAQLTIAQSVPVGAGINVTTPQNVALDDGMRALDMFEKCAIPIFGIIENMSGFRCPKCSETYDIFGASSGGATQNLAEHFKTQVVAKIPLEPEIILASDSGKPISYFHPDNNASKIYMDIARRLITFLESNKADNSSIQPIR
ncbi:P-loop NTPase [Helicobacter saguini]|uniref:Iron-sulfur cluster carrier protein n=1 Tax=Helicobacter saguini TaxID=1548018 RepID=A0A347W4B7_9HELI|nr:Mrp/NBP35 family ATP-binding protein [Helicobacter saguini]MWV61908.1 P-loop NTPase [Helicobacter saguini]MWV67417.1 P-loop NTPase [Helicobacter saguini]MWV69770.1 P-loop NTPase [Helicobacter saguini]MWV73013.1 P-loop NTPase [Helicobacter saguini]TLD95609.1 MRP family ATP-binding protein [Helicobacter saguini]